MPTISIMESPDNVFSQKSTNSRDETIVNDIVHGVINIPSYIIDIIDTVQFQRLRFINQLGFTNYVYPTSSYSRFEHSIGTFHLASRLIKQLQNQLKQDPMRLFNDTNLEISDEDVKCVEIAALCHDLGHGPFSHTWEHIVIPLLGIKNHKHEKVSCDIFLDIVENLKKGETIKQRIGLDDCKIDLIKRIILGDYDEEKDQKRKFLFEIVANKQSGLDVDKFDYICRDQIYLGWSNKNQIHDINRILHFMRVTKDEKKKEYRLAIRDREIFHIHDIFYLRHMLHRYGYCHKTVRAIECMFKDAMKKIIDNHAHILYNSVMGVVLENVDKERLGSHEFISKCCDHHIWTIMNIYANDIVKNIQERSLYKLHCKLQITDAGRVKEYESMLHEKCKDEILNHLVSVSLTKFSLQSENTGDPMLNIAFYKKSSPNSFFMFNSEELPTLVKLIDDEFILMIFTKRNEKGQGQCCEDLVKAFGQGAKILKY